MFFARVVNRHDVGMIQPTGRLGLAKKTLLHFCQFIGLELLCQSHCLDCDDAADFWIFAQVDYAHGAFPKFLLNLVAPEHRLFHSSTVQQQGTSISASTSAA